MPTTIFADAPRTASPEPSPSLDTGAHRNGTAFFNQIVERPQYEQVQAPAHDKMNVKIMKLIEKTEISRGTHVATPESRGSSMSSAGSGSTSRQGSLQANAGLTTNLAPGHGMRSDTADAQGPATRK
ncbi:hypothetical protein ACM66B_004020 [Microbotryomycetes sp. NB124-2]